ncbi:phosphatidate cytidylyltransferase [Hymenobacter armeniacus]|uniref:phosphatidate cytidylyltransferase n=1 Tax=Hymenobacter armeniacus TaxID=2771358 RepID=UPI001CC22D44|nr:phosphatidate cytidylyltransferase [Hymenobacter armeniacus]
MRVIWGVIGAAALLGSVWFSPWTFGLFFAFVQAVMLWEFYRMMRAGGYAPATWIGVGASLIIFGVTAFSFQWMYPVESPLYIAGQPIHDMITAYRSVERLGFMAAVTMVVALFTSVISLLKELGSWPDQKQPFANVGAALGGLFYVSIPMCLLIVIAYGNHGYDYRRIFALLFLIWASDIGAYAAGKTFGKHKMAPKISPGKTWEGWAGGFVMTLIVGWAIGFMLPDLPLAHRLVAAGVVAVFAPLGDLAESMLKRSVGVKDSGSIMPGHGGLLDRFDAFLLVLPVLALLQLLAG